jgi:hypothetical protein
MHSFKTPLDLAREQEDKLATKRDLKELEAKVDARFAEVKTDMQSLEYRLTATIIKWVAGLLIAQAAAIAALVKLL